MASLFELKNLVDMMSIGTLMAYTIVAVAVIILRYRPNEDGDPGSGGEYLALSAKQKLLEDQSESEEDLFHSSGGGDENPVLSPAEDDGKHTFWRLMLCPWKSCEATETSGLVANVLTLSSSTASFMLALILIHSDSSNLAAPALIFLSIIVLCTIWTWMLPAASGQSKLAFKVPLVPLLPNLSIFINLYLMLKLSMATWVRFSVWMSLGGLIYAFYGWSHSIEEKRNRF